MMTPGRFSPRRRRGGTGPEACGVVGGRLCPPGPPVPGTVTEPDDTAPLAAPIVTVASANRAAAGGMNPPTESGIRQLFFVV
jgi:hypothetical protein